MPRRLAEKALKPNEQKVTAEYSIFKSMYFRKVYLKKKINENFSEGGDATNAQGPPNSSQPYCKIAHEQCGSKLNGYILNTPLHFHGHGCSSNMAILAT